MHYRHLYHAGNFADVFKHVLLLALLRVLSRKDKPWCYVDSHAGAGLYRLDDPEVERTGEWRDGIGRLWDERPSDPLLADYLACVRAANPDGGLSLYPGSPWLAARLARPGDRVVACEAVAEVAKQLRRHVPAAVLHRRDGHEALSLLPPVEKRGLVLVDPPFERVDEFDAAADFVRQARSRFASGVYAIWYPLKNRHAANRFRRRAAGESEALALQFDVGAAEPGRMHACGLLVINPPFGIAPQAEAVLRALLPVLRRGAGAAYSVETINGVQA